ncbi:MAG: hypothetical protein KDE51_23095 [Anaerolineales bacterium]|nr:hypothetical protein [Anaerolineales bacterium]
MFDWLRNLRKTEEEKRQEQLTAYIDGELSAREQQAFEQELARNDALRADVDAQQQVKLMLKQAPRLRAPRNFTLDPAVYGQRTAYTPSFAERLYPQLRVATAVMAVLLVGVISLEFLSNPTAEPAMAPAANVALVTEEAEFSTTAQEAEPPMAESQAAPAAAVMSEETADEEMDAAAGATEMVEEGEAADEAALAIPTATAQPTLTAAATAEPPLEEESIAATVVEDAAAEADTAEEAPVAPRPSATVGPAVRSIDEDDNAVTDDGAVEIIPTASLVPPSTPAVGATVMPVNPTDQFANEDVQFGLLRWAQMIIGAAAVLLLGATLYVRRQLRQ